MPGVVFVGCAFGDEGKGKIVDYAAEDADMVVRYAGGPNAGHTLIVDGEKIILRLIPSGVLHPETKCVLAQGMAIDPLVLMDEIFALEERGVSLEGRLFISDSAHVIFPHHINMDGIEAHSIKIGTTKKGVGPTYTDKASRRGMRMGTVVAMSMGDIREYVEKIGERDDKESIKFKNALDVIGRHVCDTSHLIYEALKDEQLVIFEGAQGTMLDLDHGTYPFVTSSSAVSGGACTGSGIGPTMIDSVVGITKAYITRVGEGPFPTKIKDEERATWLRDAGNEYGSVTKRPRDVGWLDLPMLKYAIRVNDISSLALTKLDVLSGLDEVQVCTGYELDGESCNGSFPLSRLKDVQPVYETFPGWSVEDVEKLSGNVTTFIDFIEAMTGVRVLVVSTGPERKQTRTLAMGFGSSEDLYGLDIDEIKEIMGIDEGIDEVIDMPTLIME